MSLCSCVTAAAGVTRGLRDGGLGLGPELGAHRLRRVASGRGGTGRSRKMRSGVGRLLAWSPGKVNVQAARW